MELLKIVTQTKIVSPTPMSMGEDAPLTPAFVTALEMSAQAHAQMVAAVAPFVDTSISKTVNVPADYPYADFEQLYQQAWKLGLKGLATFRPNAVIGSVLSTQPAPLTVVDGEIIAGDVITAINDEPIETADDMLNALEKLNPGDTATLTLWRAGATRKVSVTLAESSE